MTNKSTLEVKTLGFDIKFESDNNSSREMLNSIMLQQLEKCNVEYVINTINIYNESRWNFKPFASGVNMDFQKEITEYNEKVEFEDDKGMFAYYKKIFDHGKILFMSNVLKDKHEIIEKYIPYCKIINTEIISDIIGTSGYPEKLEKWIGFERTTFLKEGSNLVTVLPIFWHFSFIGLVSMTFNMNFDYQAVKDITENILFLKRFYSSNLINIFLKQSIENQINNKIQIENIISNIIRLKRRENNENLETYFKLDIDDLLFYPVLKGNKEVMLKINDVYFNVNFEKSDSVINKIMQINDIWGIYSHVTKS